MAKNETAPEMELPTENLPETAPVNVGETANTSATDGVRARRGLTMKNLLPSHDWINKNVVANGKGTRALVGRIYGVATSTTDKVNEFQGQQLQSIAVNGAFYAESYLTGEVSQATSAFLPMAYAEKIKAVFAMDSNVKAVEIDCDIGLEATGKTIPYEWVVIAYREGEEMAALKRIKATRARPAPEKLLISGEGAPLQLTAPAK